MPSISLTDAFATTTANQDDYNTVQIILGTDEKSIPLIPNRGGKLHEFIGQSIVDLAPVIAEASDLLIQELPDHLILERVDGEISGTGTITLTPTVYNQRLGQAMSVVSVLG